MSVSKPGAGILSCRWRRRGEASFSIHEVSWPFACRARALHVCVCVWELQASHLRPTHTYCSQATPYRSTPGRKNKSMPVSVWGVSVCGCTHTDTHTHIHRAYRMFMQGRGGGLSRLEGVSSTVCNPPPTMYDPFVFCDRRGRRKRSI